MEVEHEQALAEPSNHGNDGSLSTHIDKSTAFAAMLRNSELLKHFVNTFNAVPPLEDRPSPQTFLPESFTAARAELLAKPTKHLAAAHQGMDTSPAPSPPATDKPVRARRAPSPELTKSPSATITTYAVTPKSTVAPQREHPEVHSRPSSLSSSEASLPGCSPLLPTSSPFIASALLPPMAGVSMATAAALASQAQLQVQLHAQAQMAAQLEAVRGLPPIGTPEGLGAMSSVVPMWDMYGDPHKQSDRGTPSAIARALSITSTPRRPRSEKKPIPEDLKDNKYFERRKRNNMAAKKSRDARKSREDEIAIRASFLEKENAILRAQVATLREEANSLRQLLLQKRSQP